MAKRRKLEAPSANDLSRIEEEFRRETGAGAQATRGLAPIAQIAGAAAAQASALDADARTEQARLTADAEKLRSALAEGRVLVDLPLASIDADAMIRDRTVLNESELVELRLSIAANGLRLPIEVYERTAPAEDVPRYVLLSGYRRLIAMRGLFELTGDDRYRTIRALVRPRAEVDAAYVAMVEENEVRAELSHFERGRIAVIAAQQGAFVNVEDAVGRLFSTASKAKRSKVRSFALIFEELGDMLAFPEELTERRGLRIAQALRGGLEPVLRQALADASPESADEEWSALEPVITRAEAGPRDTSRGGRPGRSTAGQTGWRNAETLVTSAGITIRRKHDGQGYLLRFEGAKMDSELMDSLMEEIRNLLEKP